MECNLTECGHTPDGLKVRAITDSAGPQVVVMQEPPKENLLSKPLANHKAAVRLGKRVAKRGVKVYDGWCGLIGLSEFLAVAANERGH